MTQGQRIAKELEYLAGDLFTLLSDNHDDTMTMLTLAHTLGRIFALVRELHSIFKIALIEDNTFKGGKA